MISNLKNFKKVLATLALIFVFVLPLTNVNVNAAEKNKVYVTVERSSIGQGYIVQPTVVEFEGKITAAQVITKLLKDNNVEYKNTGTVEDGFYLSQIVNGDTGKLAIPKAVQNIPGFNMSSIGENTNAPDLGEHSYSILGGWLYTVDGQQVGQGMSQQILHNGEIVRVQFTAVNFGQDIDKMNNFGGITLPKRDELIKQAALAAQDKDALFANKAKQETLNQAIKVLADFDSTQEEINNVLTELQNVPALDSVVQDIILAINKLPNEITLNEKDKINNIEKEYKSLDNSKQLLVFNYDKLVEAEKNIEELEKQQQINEQKANEVIDLINKLPNQITLDNKTQINEIKEAYNALTKDQQNIVSNYNKVIDAEKVIKNLEVVKADKQKATAVDTLINKIPGSVALKNKNQVTTARNAYNKLSNTQKKYVTEYAKLTKAEASIKSLEFKAAQAAKVATQYTKDKYKRNTKVVTKYNNGKTKQVKYYSYYGKGKVVKQRKITTYYNNGKKKSVQLVKRDSHNKITYQKTTYYRTNGKTSKKVTYSNYRKGVWRKLQTINYNSKGATTKNKITTRYNNKRTKSITTYSNYYKKTWHKKQVLVKRSNNKRSSYKITTRYKNKRTKQIITYHYNKQGKLKSNKYGKATKNVKRYNAKGKRVSNTTKHYK